MALHTPPKGWQEEGLPPEERVWLVLATLFAIVFLSAFMGLWHLTGRQTTHGEAYQVDPAAFRQEVMAFAERYRVGELHGVPVVAPPPGDVYLMAQAFSWYPVLKLKKGETYRLRVASVDYPHGFSLYPHEWSLQLYPGYEWVYPFTPTRAGEYALICNDYCGLGHHAMVGRILVEE
ncbi:cytochrome C oxidase subunit II [Thermus thermamylovorans]|uniref:Cytochrome C oxidase subunit II n=1 Tax=Thermus thermamylovorans TaxID=2509362 RepID=A0A4Q9B410_9DEIN|nr:cytochrome C oxidase subunit II [Thermus thermamylovorans]TBH20056.1 cytochrome C oxidase subunit II [Thermus thermamylovorans]